MAKDQAVPETERRFSQEQYDRLKRCSEKGEEGIKEWNQWRAQNPDAEVLLEGAELTNAFLAEADLKHVKFYGAVLEGADIRGANISRCDLRNANFRTAVVDGMTAVWKPEINQCRGTWKAASHERTYTDFQGVPLNAIRTDPVTKQLLEYNVRRANWQQWYQYEDWRDRCTKKQKLRWWPFVQFIRGLWWISDYGLSTGRIVATFFILALIFAALYYIAAIAGPPGVVNSLLEGEEGVVPGWLVPFRAVYFSVVTMTTLGFGDMYANCQSFWGHALLILQVLLGYVLLGALVTRFAVLFTAGGPAGRFAQQSDKR